MKEYKTIATAITSARLTSDTIYLLSATTRSGINVIASKDALRAVVLSDYSALNLCSRVQMFSAIIHLASIVSVDSVLKNNAVPDVELAADREMLERLSTALRLVMDSNPRNKQQYRVELSFGIIRNLVSQWKAVDAAYPTQDEINKLVVALTSPTAEFRSAMLNALRNDIYLEGPAAVDHYPLAIVEVTPAIMEQFTCGEYMNHLVNKYPVIVSKVTQGVFEVSVVKGIIKTCPITPEPKYLEWLSTNLCMFEEYVNGRYIQSARENRDMATYHSDTFVDHLLVIVKNLPKQGLALTLNYYGEYKSSIDGMHGQDPVIARLVEINDVAVDKLGKDLYTKLMGTSTLKDVGIEPLPSPQLFNFIRPSTVGKSPSEIIAEGMLLSIHGLIHMLTADRADIERLCTVNGYPNLFTTIINLSVIDATNTEVCSLYHLDDLQSKLKATESRMAAIGEYARQLARMAGQDDGLNEDVVIAALCDLRIGGGENLRVYVDKRSV